MKFIKKDIYEEMLCNREHKKVGLPRTLRVKIFYKKFRNTHIKNILKSDLVTIAKQFGNTMVMIEDGKICKIGNYK